ncbi:hypothetical protein PRZ48_009783 [Zasmidium cellare]|uniref:Periplasmic binding protein-like II n=1 Tax=Zasmidium cellare TaxID=395010 RepID=A0ABR0EDA7_ZASCE|nr:hypothetical protein PRZ48_009783 [Zasmidium cellare]
MRTSTPLALALTSALASAQFTPTVPIDDRSLSDIYAAARREYTSNSTRPLQVFWGGDAGDQGDGIRTAWAQQFPDIPLNLTVILSKYADTRLDEAFYEGTEYPVVDVAALQTLRDFPRWKTQNRLVYYKPANWEDLLANENDPDGAFLAFSIYSFGTIYFDSSKVSADDVPSTFESFADPRWKGKLILTYPNDDDAVAYLFSLIVSHYGFGWLRALAANDVQWVRGTGTPIFELERQHNDTSSKRALTFTSGSGSSASWGGSKAVEPPEKIMSWPQTVATFAGTPQPETAKLFVSWLVSNDRQNGSSPSVLNSLNEANGVSPYTSNTTIFSGFRTFETDRAGVEWWKNVFEEALDTPQGPDPLAVYPNPSS